MAFSVEVRTDFGIDTIEGVEKFGEDTQNPDLLVVENNQELLAVYSRWVSVRKVQK